MPAYEYRCKVCGHVCETLKDSCSRDIDAQVCVCCGGQMVRIVSKSSVHYKGSGFYYTDYKKT